MRKDMLKLLSERPRSGSRMRGTKLGKRLPPTADLDPEDSGPERVSSSPQGPVYGRGWGDKERNQRLKPLRRFLDSRVGRPWDEVYSEIRKSIHWRRAMGYRVLDRLDRLVATDCFLEDGRVVQPGWLGSYPPRTFYAHPKTGLLCRPAPLRYRRPQPEIARVVIDELHCFEKIDGIWYRLEFEKRKNLFYWTKEPFEFVVTSKKQCSRKELKAIAQCVEERKGTLYSEVHYGKMRWVPAD
jgi:hypothetical protein